MSLKRISISEGEYSEWRNEMDREMDELASPLNVLEEPSLEALLQDVMMFGVDDINDTTSTFDIQNINNGDGNGCAKVEDKTYQNEPNLVFKSPQAADLASVNKRQRKQPLRSRICKDEQEVQFSQPTAGIRELPLYMKDPTDPSLDRKEKARILKAQKSKNFHNNQRQSVLTAQKETRDVKQEMKFVKQENLMLKQENLLLKQETERLQFLLTSRPQ